MLGSPFVKPALDVTITFDALIEGWRAKFECRAIAGRFKPEHKSKNINWLEMEAARITLQHKAALWRDKTLRFLVDNSTTVAHIIKQGGTH